MDNQANHKLKMRIITEEINQFPRDIVLETTGFCNLKCKMCSNSKMTRRKETMHWPLFIKLIEEIAEKAGDSIRLWLCFYGEPLMERNFSDRVIYAKSKGIKNVVINSNMNLMHPELSRKLVKAGLNTVFAGVDAGSPETYAQIRVGGDYKKVVNNIISYKDALNKYGHSDQQIIVQFIDMPQNHHEKSSVVEFWRRYGIQVKVRPFITWQESQTDIPQISQDMAGESERLPCHWMMNILPITADGKAVWCGCDYDGNGIVGDLNEMTIFEVWNNIKKAHRFVQLESRWNELPDFCRNCGDWRGAYAEYKE